MKYLKEMQRQRTILLLENAIRQIDKKIDKKQARERGIRIHNAYTNSLFYHFSKTANK